MSITIVDSAERMATILAYHRRHADVLRLTEELACVVAAGIHFVG